MSLYFITGNAGKFREVKAIIPEIEQLEIDLHEIQSPNPREVVEHKLRDATKHHTGEFIVDDTSVYCEFFDYKLPGPLIKGFLQALGSKRLAEIIASTGKVGVRVEAILGYTDGKEAAHYFDGQIEGTICMPSGDPLHGFGWDPIFKPNGHDKTFAEMSPEEKNSISHRAIAARKLKAFLDSRGEKI